MGKKSELIKVAKSYEGENYYRFTKDFGCTDVSTVRNSFAWCAAFVSVCGKNSGNSDCIPRSTSCNDIIAWYKSRNRFTRDKSKVNTGYLVMYDWDVNPSEYRPADHIGIVIDFDKTYIWVIEGNKGNDYNDKTKVGIRKIERTSKYIYGYCTPDFEDESTTNTTATTQTDKIISADVSMVKNGSQGETVKTLQAILSRKGYAVEIDGDFGNQTETAVKKFQSDKGLDSDGICGHDTWTALLK